MYSYGVGQMVGDLTGTIWFSYSMFFISQVMHLPIEFAGLVVLVGQIADGVSNPLVGILSDKTPPNLLGKRTSWYLLGFVLRTIGFILFYNASALIGITSGDIQLSQAAVAFFMIAGSMQTVGYSCLQISHMAIVNEITYAQNRRDNLIALRNGFIFASNFTALFICIIVF
jgi:GPH family glycoside/pentoside/hexuronide:cation symporter